MNPNKNKLSSAQKELIEFINPVDSPDIVQSLKRVHSVVYFAGKHSLTSELKDDLFVLEKIIRISQKMNL